MSISRLIKYFVKSLSIFANGLLYLINNFDFLNNIPENIRDALKKQGTYSPPSGLSASLLADVDPTTTSSWHLLESNIVPINLVALSEIKIEGEPGDENSVFPNNVPKFTRLFPKAFSSSALKVYSNEMSAGQIDIGHISLPQIAVKESGTFQITRGDFGFPEVAVPELSSSQIATVQVDTAQVDIVKASATQVEALQFSPTQVSVFQNDVLKVSTTSSISPEQFISSYLFHNSSPASI